MSLNSDNYLIVKYLSQPHTCLALRSDQDRTSDTEVSELIRSTPNLLLKPSTLLEFGYPQGLPASKESTTTLTLQHLESVKEPEWIGFSHQDFSLPGIEPKGSKCARWNYRGCLRTSKHPQNKAYIEHYQYSCNRALCEVCSKRWRDREADAIKDRIWRGRKIFRELPVHVVISVPTWDYDRPIKDIKELATSLLKRVGMKSFAVVFHPARFDRRSGRLVPYISPHFHVIGFGWITKVGEVYKDSGYIIKNLGVRRTKGEVFSTAQYELSHVGIKTHHHAVTWHGDLSYAKLKSRKSIKEHRCPYCGDKVHALHYTLPSIKLDEPPPPDGEWKMLRDASGYDIVTTNYREHHD